MPTFEEDAEENGKDDCHSSQCKRALNPFNLTIKSQISISISYQHIRQMSASRHWARWQSLHLAVRSGAFVCVLVTFIFVSNSF